MTNTSKDDKLDLAKLKQAVMFIATISNTQKIIMTVRSCNHA